MTAGKGKGKGKGQREERRKGGAGRVGRPVSD